MYLVARLVRMLRVSRRYNENLRELNCLDDRELADIGITRCDIQRIEGRRARLTNVAVPICAQQQAR